MKLKCITCNTMKGCSKDRLEKLIKKNENIKEEYVCRICRKK